MFFHLEMVVPEVDKNLLQELEGMGFSTERATRALHYSGELKKKNKHTVFYYIICPVIFLDCIEGSILLFLFLFLWWLCILPIFF